MYNILNERAVISISGEDKQKFLQGLLTNDINKLNETNSIYACMLTPQGKYFADFFFKMEKDIIYADLPYLRKEEILKKLNIYKLRSAVTFTEHNDHKVVAFFKEEPNKGSMAFIDPRSEAMGLRAYIKDNELPEITKDIEQNQNSYDLARIDNFITEGEKDLVAGQSFPLEYGLDELNAIDYKKGCYVGQELVARTHYRGVIRKQIVQISSSSKLPELGSIIYAGDQKIGIMCSSVDNIGLALIRTEDFMNLDPSVKITVQEQEVKLKFKENI